MRFSFVGFWLVCAALVPAATAGATDPAIDITVKCEELVPLYNELPVNECFVNDLIRRENDDFVIGATCGKKQICLFSFDAKSGEVKRLDAFEALWWDEPRLALGPDGSIYLGARRAFDKQFVFERLRERAQTPDSSYKRRDTVPAPGEVNEEAAGMPIRCYSPEGALLREIPLPEALAKDGVGALAVCDEDRTLCGLSSPGGHFFTVSLAADDKKDLGEVVPFPTHHHTRPISKTLMVGDDGRVYFSGCLERKGGENDDASMGLILAFDPGTGEIETLDAHLPAVIGRRRLASVDAAVKLGDGSFLGGTSDGYLFRFDPKTKAVETFGKPLRQHQICGLARAADGMVYGAGGEPGGLPRLFAFDLATRTMVLGTPPGGNPPEQGTSTFGDIGGVVCTANGTLVYGERERRSFLLVYRPAGERLAWRHETAGADLGQCLRDRFIEYSEAGIGIQLAPTYLISDVMARSSRVHEPLSEDVYARKVFRLRSPCREAEVLFFGGGGTAEAPMSIRVNGHDVMHAQDKDAMLTGGWDRETIPGEYLREGENEIVFGHAGHLLVDTDATGTNNSSKGNRAEGPWRAGVLGPDNDLAGEYVVRIRVHGRPAEGTVTSPVIDLAEQAKEEESGIAPGVAVKRVRLKGNAATPPNTAILLEARFGSTPDYSPAAWGTWQPADSLHSAAQFGRFAQWRAVLRSGHTDLTPVLKGVALEAGGEASAVNGTQVRVTATPGNDVAVSSYPFYYADPHHPRMRHLREKYNLEEVVAGGETETEKFALLRQWVREQWEGWDYGKYQYCPQWDALEILELAPADLALGMCTHFAATFVQCAAALGYHARVLIVDHHCLTEIWSDEYGKWILEDPAVSGHYVSFQYEVDGTPINALEMHQRSLAGNAGDVEVMPDPPMPEEGLRQQMVRLYVRFCIPLRNDHLYRAEPQELEHGFDQYHWDGYLWWTDSLDPKYPEYSLLTNRPEDFYWTLNKTVITLEDTDTAGTVGVQLSGPIPNLSTFMIQLQDGDWRESERSFTWELAPGKNVLRAKAVNTMGLEGPENRVELEYATGQ